VAVTRKGRNEGQRWARFEFSDLHGTANGVVFADEFTKYGKHLKKGAIVFLRGRVDFQGNEPSLRAQEVVPVEAAHALLAGGMVVDMEEAEADPATLTRLRDLCASHHGQCPVHVRVRAPERGSYCIRVGRSMYVEPSEELYQETLRLVGDGRVRFTKRESNGNGSGARRRTPRRTSVWE
jgi:DNA polymerase-3 subunit alpha